MADEAGDSLRQWVTAARRAGLSWAVIGDTLGITRQAAQQRFTDRSELTAPDDGSDEIVRRGVTAFNEVRVLEEEGLAGREVTRAGWGRLYFRQTDRHWENVRLATFRRNEPIEKMTAEGWTLAFRWYPYLYFKRPLDVTIDS